MEGVRNYLVSVVAVCMLTVPGIVFVKKDGLQRIVRLVGGVLILLVAMQPLLRIDLKDLSESLKALTRNYELDTSSLAENAQKKIAETVKEASEQTIEEKASELGATLQAEVTVSEGELPVPVHVKLIGSIEPEQIQTMEDFIVTAFNISLEEQEWKLYGFG